jgi:hypothetical protein
LCEKKFSVPGIAARRSFAQAPRQKFFSSRARIARRHANCDGAKTLVPRGFLRNAKKRAASPKCSPGKNARAMNCIAVVRATRDQRAVIAHFLLTGFGVSCLLLYKLQRDARQIG